MTRAAKRDVDKDALRETWEKQAAGLGFDAKALVASAMERGLDGAKTERDRPAAERRADLPGFAAREAVDWALAHLSERDAVFAKTDLLAAALAYAPGAASIGAVERAVTDLQREGRLHEAPAFESGGWLTTDKAVADERETIALMRAGEGRGRAPMRGWMVDRHLRKGPLTAGQKQAVKLILSGRDRTVGSRIRWRGQDENARSRPDACREEGLAGDRARAFGLGGADSRGGVRHCERNLAEVSCEERGRGRGRLTKKGAKEMRAAFEKTVLVVDEGSLASTVQARDLLRIAGELRIPKLVLVGDAKQLDAVDAGKPFAQLQQAGMRTAVMDEISGKPSGVTISAITTCTQSGRLSRL